MNESTPAPPVGRVERLQQLTSALSRAATVDEVTDVVVTTVTEELGAGAALVALLQDDETAAFEIVQAVGYLPETLEQWRTFPLDAPLPAGDALRSGEMVVLESLAERDRRYPAFRGTAAAHEAFAIVPLLVEGTKPLGIIAFGFEHARVLERSDRSFVQSVADQCAQAIHRARLYDDQRAVARQRGFLHEAGQAFAEAATYEELARLVARLAVPELGDGALLYMHVPGGLRLAATWHGDPGRRELVEQLSTRESLTSHPLLDRAFTDRELVAVELDDVLVRAYGAARDDLRALRDLGIASALLLPLLPRSSPIGVLALVRDERRPFSPSDRSLATSYTSLAALHCDNARLLEEQRRIARRLQDSLLPPMLPIVPGIDIAAVYAAAGTGAEVGGDFYDVFQTGDDRWFAVTGDVRGRGLDAAATTGLARHVVRAAAAVPAAQPSAVVERLNELLFASYESDPLRPEPRFCALCVVSLQWTKDGVEATLCCSGHPLPRLVDRDGKVTEVGVPGTVAGVLAEPELADVTVRLHPGDRLVLFTDGISERHTGSAFFEDHLPDVLSAGAALDARALAEQLRDEATAFAADEPDDDMAVLVVRVLPGPERRDAGVTPREIR